MSDNSKNADKHEARQLAVEILYSLDFKDELDKEIDLELFPGKNEKEMESLSEVTAFYARYLVSGVYREMERINGIISSHSINRPLEKINYVDRNILRVAVFELLEVNELHPHIIIDEAVKLSQEMSTNVTYKFINGMLDTIAKKVR